ncbi:MAG: type II toxin-antitoxin system RelE/ParE family toxin [Janthinobacterium lividum]
MNTHTVVVSDPADADIEQILNRLVMLSVEAAVAWQVSFEATLSSLTSLPHRYPKARDGSRYPSVIARQLYFGKYRLIFHVLEAASDETEGTVIILRVLYGAQSMEHRPQDQA